MLRFWRASIVRGSLMRSGWFGLRFWRLCAFGLCGLGFSFRRLDSVLGVLSLCVAADLASVCDTFACSVAAGFDGLGSVLAVLSLWVG